MFLHATPISSVALVAQISPLLPVPPAQSATSTQLILEICGWIAIACIVGIVFFLFFGRRPPKRNGQYMKWCPGRKPASKLVRLVRFGPLCSGCWYDLTDAPVDDTGSITCPECGRVLDANRPKDFRRRKPRWKLAAVCVMLLLGSIGTSAYVIAQSPSWVKTLPDVALAVIFQPEKLTSGVPSAHQQMVLDEIAARAGTSKSIFVRAFLNPKLERLVRDAPSLNTFGPVVVALGERGEFLADELIDYIDKTNPMGISPSWAQSTMYAWLAGTRSPKIIDAVYRWAKDTSSSTDQRERVEATGMLVESVRDKRAIEFLIDTRSQWSKHELREQWHRRFVQCVVANAPLDADLADRVCAELQKDVPNFHPWIRVEAVMAMLESGQTAEQFSIAQIDAVERGDYQHLQFLIWRAREHKLQHQDMVRIVRWIASDEPELWKLSLRVVSEYQRSQIGTSPNSITLTTENLVQYFDIFEQQFHQETNGLKRDAIESVMWMIQHAKYAGQK